MLVLDSWGLSSVEVGDLLQRDHATVLHGLIRGRQIPEVVKYADDAKERFEAEWLSRQPNHMTMLSGIT